MAGAWWFWLLPVVLGANFCSAITFVRPPNYQGPGAVLAGQKCLTLISRHYFNETRASRTKNMVIMHSANLSSPAAEIEVNFLAQMHQSIAANELTGWATGCVQ